MSHRLSRHLPADEENWTQENFVFAIGKLRDRAKSLRKRANKLDAEAERMRQKAARFATQNLPLFEQ